MVEWGLRSKHDGFMWDFMGFEHDLHGDFIGFHGIYFCMGISLGCVVAILPSRSPTKHSWSGPPCGQPMANPNKSGYHLQKRPCIHEPQEPHGTTQVLPTGDVRSVRLHQPKIHDMFSNLLESGPFLPCKISIKLSLESENPMKMPLNPVKSPLHPTSNRLKNSTKS